MDSRYWIDGLIIIGLAILLQAYTDDILKSTLKMNEYSSLYTQYAINCYSTNDPTACQTMTDYKSFWANEADNTVYGFKMLLVYNLLLLLIYLSVNIMQVVLAVIRRKKFNSIIPELVVNFCGFGLTLYILLLYWFDYNYKTYDDPELKSVYIIRDVANDKHVKFLLTGSLIIALQWARLFNVFQASKMFGPLIKILVLMLADVSRFAVLFILFFLTSF